MIGVNFLHFVLRRPVQPSGVIAAEEACFQGARALVEQLKLPSLSQFGLTESMFPQIIEMSKKSSSMRFNPVVLADETLANILRSVL